MARAVRFTEDEFVRECHLSAFLGAFKFWEQVKAARPLPTEVAAYGDGVLRAMAVFSYAAVDGKPRSTQEKEAFKHFGL